MDLKTYAKEEAEAILNGERLLSEREIMVRWNYDVDSEKDRRRFYKTTWKLRSGRHKCGVVLPAVNIDSQHRLYRLADVLAVELAMRNSL